MRYNTEEMKVLRLKHGYSFEYVAKNIGYTHKRAYHRIEKGEKGMSVGKLKRLADLYGVNMDNFIKR
ncbi:helix-turn-helix domain-containing protein [Bacillus cereus]|uniref:helix-turn-helix domain-containing protein n=1 Tax=Bacillus cereus TaxID=1396 RepID=UPI0003AB035D|nr:helix-turn-helix transcriptional regulator [Bacillus cereus]